MSAPSASLPQPLNIYTASAGAGKTFTLTETYLRLVLASPHAYRHILAVTFTNLATLEMKERILTELNTLSRNPEQSPYRDSLTQSSGLSLPELKRRALFTLRDLLFDFSQFKIKTIDSFFQDVLRALSLELGLPSSLRVDTSPEFVVNEAVERLLYASNEDVRRYLLHYVEHKDQPNGEGSYSFSSEEKADENKTLNNFRKDLTELAGQLQREDVCKAFILEQEGGKGSFPTLQEIESFKKEAKGCIENIIRKYKELFTPLANFSAMESLQKDLYKKSHSDLYFLYKRAVQVCSGKAAIDDKTITLAKLQTYLNCCSNGTVIPTVEDFYDFFLSPTADPSEDFHAATELYIAIMSFHVQAFPKLLSFRACLKHIDEMALLHFLSEQITEIKNERQILFIDNTKEILRRIINDDSTPFIYERYGSRIDHYMIDEFQDTSRFQYENFLPLLQNALAEGKRNKADEEVTFEEQLDSAQDFSQVKGGLSTFDAQANESMVVGDVKQSIYRFRNSDPAILQYDLDQDFNDYCAHHTLDYNWRSAPAIIHFNNFLFARLPKLLDLRLIPDLPAYRQIKELYTPCSETFTTFLQQVPEQKENRPGGVFLHTYYSLNNEEEEGIESSVNAPTVSLPSPNPEELEEEIEIESNFSVAAAHIPEVIVELLKRGYAPGDIAVLAPLNQELSIVAQALMRYRIEHPGDEFAEQMNFVSEELLQLYNNASFRLAVAILYHLSDTSPSSERTEESFSFQVAAEQWRLLTVQKKSNESTQVSSEEIDIQPFGEAMTGLRHAAAQLPLYELVEHIEQLLHPLLVEEDIPYMIALLDLVHGFEKDNTADVQGFLRWMERNPRALVLSSKTEGAINLLTIHASKGLGFPVVLLVSVDFALTGGKNSMLWLPLPKELKEELPGTHDTIRLLPISSSQALISTLFAQDYLREFGRTLVDNLNKLYVACTRAESELHIWVPYHKDAGKQRQWEICKFFTMVLNSLVMPDDAKSVGEARTLEIHEDEEASRFQIMKPGGEVTYFPEGKVCSHVLTYADLPLCNPAEKVSGTVVQHTENQERQSSVEANRNEAYTFSIDQFVYSSPQTSLAVKLKPVHSYRERESIVYGELLHSILSRVQWINDLSDAVHTEIQAGNLPLEQKERVEHLLREVLSSSPVAAYFDPQQGWQVFNERSILIPTADVHFKYRPDRLLYHPDTERWVVIDYKSGQVRSEHKKQVTRYCRLLRQSVGLEGRGPDLFTTNPASSVEGYLLYIDSSEDSSTAPFSWLRVE